MLPGCERVPLDRYVAGRMAERVGVRMPALLVRPVAPLLRWQRLLVRVP
jgi:hypothetical protein